MALLTISGEPASRWEEVAHGAAQLLGFELVTATRLAKWMTEEFGDAPVPPRAWRPATVTVLARLAQDNHLIIALEDAERLFPPLPMLWHAWIVAPSDQRVGNLMLDLRLEKAEAQVRLRELDAERNRQRKSRFGRAKSLPAEFDIALNLANVDPAQASDILASAAAKRLDQQGLLPPATAEELQFNARMELARRGIVPAGRAEVKKVGFGHPSEKLFANLLDFYRIEWDYEPRSFPLQWNKDGAVTEAFTPDFYLPEFDLYVELTTMKQALATRKNRKVKRLRAIYPHVNIQVFYQKDFQDLVFKHGMRLAVS